MRPLSPAGGLARFSNLFLRRTEGFVLLLHETLQENFQAKAHRVRAVGVLEHALIEELSSLEPQTDRQKKRGGTVAIFKAPTSTCGGTSSAPHLHTTGMPGESNTAVAVTSQVDSKKPIRVNVLLPRVMIHL